MRVQALASLLKMHKTAKTAPAPTRDCQVQGSEFFESFTTATPALAVHAHLARACVVCVCCRHSACEKEWDRFPVAAGGRPDDLARPTRGTLLAEHKANDKQPGWLFPVCCCWEVKAPNQNPQGNWGVGVGLSLVGPNRCTIMHAWAATVMICRPGWLQ